MLETPWSYRLLATLANRLLPLATPWSAKLAMGDRERRRAVARWVEWARDHRDRARPLLWVHAPSVGEGLQANEVLRILRERHPEWQIVYSFFSPSGASLAGRQPVDHADYLPYDTRANAVALLTALAPRAVVFTKLDLWPELATTARRTDAQVGMIAATVSPVSGRLNPLVRPLTAAGYRAISRAGAIDGPDAERLASLGTDPGVITITGDPRFDSADRRARQAETERPLGRLTAGGATLVAGSTWPADETVLLGALAIVRRRHPEASLVVVPHEPTPRHLARLERRAAQRGLPITRLSALGPGATAPLVVVDQVGVLAGLYAGAAIAYVGGGFGAAGLHSVLEPAACGIPTAFGPRWRSSREAGLLLAARAAAPVGTGQSDRAAEDLADRWIEWLDHPADRIEQGRRAAAVVRNELGAAERSAELVERMMTA